MFPEGAICPAGLCETDALCQYCLERAFAGEAAVLTSSGEGSVVWSRQEPGTDPVSQEVAFSWPLARVRCVRTLKSPDRKAAMSQANCSCRNNYLMVLQPMAFHCLTYVKVQAEGMGACSQFRWIFGG